MQDNTRTFSGVYVGLPDDVDRNHVVDLRDFYKIAMCFGARKGDSKCLADCDLDGDGKIDTKDLYRAAMDYGRTG